MRQGRYLNQLSIILGIVLVATFLIPLGPVADAMAGEAPPVKPISAEAAQQFLDARSYAADYNVTIREAKRRIRAQNQMSGVVDLLRKGSGRRFAGLWIEHQPDFQLVVRLTGKQAAPAGLKAAVGAASSSLPIVFETGAAVPLNDLLNKVQSALPDLLAILPDTAGTDVDVTTGDIVLLVHALGAERDEVRAKIPELERRLGAPVRIDFLDTPLENHAVRGGATLSTCTTGFVVANSAGTRGVLTAGHCGNSQSYSDFDGTSTSTTFVSELFDADQDVQWHTTPQTELPEFYADLVTTPRVLTGRRLRSSTAVGNTACHRGIGSGYSCGTVQSTTFQPTFAGACNGFTCTATYIRLTGTSLVCAGGDSGGPWFNGQTAFGIHKGGSSTDCFYMSTDYISGLGVSLVYGP